MAEYKVGDNLYGNDDGSYYSKEHRQGKDGKWYWKTAKVTSPFDSSKTYLNNLYNAQQTSQLDALKQSQTKATAGFNQQKKDLVPQYQAQRNQADVTSAQNVSRLRELMAANGINSSGENVTASAGLASQRQGALSEINTQQNQATSALDRQIADVNDPAQAQAIRNQIGTTRAGALSDAYNQYLQRLTQQQQDYSTRAWQQYIFNNVSAEQRAGLGMNKYQIDSNNAATTAANTAELEYYKNAGFNQDPGGGGKTASGPAAFQSNMKSAIKEGVDASWAPLLSEIIKRESSYNPNAKNPKSTAYGYGQFLASTRRTYEKKLGLDYSNPVHQIIMMAQYVKDRYKTPQNALAFWNKNHWY